MKYLIILILTLPVYTQIVIRETVTPKQPDGLYEFVSAYYAVSGDTLRIEIDKPCNSIQITDNEGTMLYGIENSIGEQLVNMIEQRQKRRKQGNMEH
jgi:hypothetical protein